MLNTLLSFIVSLLVFLLTISVLVFVHEFGHFAVARMFKIDVERFSIGFGKALGKFVDRKNTEYVFAPILLGGYVKLNEDSYKNKSIWAKMVVMLAGITASMILAIVVFWTIFIIGLETPKPIIGKITPHSIAAKAGLQAGHEIKIINQTEVHSWQDVLVAIMPYIGNTTNVEIDNYQLKITKWDTIKSSDPLDNLGIIPYTPEIPAIIGKILPDSSAAKIGLKVQDEIITINQLPVKDWLSLITYIQQHPNQTVSLTIKRNTKIYRYTGEIGDKSHFGKSIGYLGAAPLAIPWPKGTTHLQKHGVFKSFLPAIKQTFIFLKLHWVILTKLISGKLSLNALGGPVTIFSTASLAFKQGLIIYLNFLGLFSVMLAFINLLPIPGLDGGNFFLLAIEAVLGKPLPLELQTFLVRIGALLLAVIISIALWNDLKRLFLGD